MQLLRKEKEKKMLQLSAIQHFQELMDEISEEQGSDLPSIELGSFSSVMQALLFCGIPIEKWYLCEEIVQEIFQPELFEDLTLWRSILHSWILHSPKAIIEAQLRNFSRIDDADFDRVLTIEAKEYLKKFSKEDDSDENFAILEAPDSYYALAVNYFGNFDGLFETEENRMKEVSTKEGMIRAHSFLILLMLSFDFMRKEADALNLYLELLILFEDTKQGLLRELDLGNLIMVSSGDAKMQAFMMVKNSTENENLLKVYTSFKNVYMDLSCISDILDYGRKQEKILQVERKTVLKEMQLLDSLIQKYRKEREVYSVEEELLSLSNERLKKQILLLLRKNNRKRVQFYEKELQKYHTSNVEAIRSLLLLHGCNPSILTEEEMEQFSSLCTTEKLQEGISILEKEEIPWKENYFFLFTNSTIPRMRRVASYVKRKILPVSFLLQNLEFFDVSSPLSTEFEKVLSELESISIAPRDVAKKNASLFLQDATMFAERLSLYQKYQVQFTENKENCYDYLEEDRFIDLLDACIEVGIGPSVKQNPSFLSRDREHLPKVARLLQEMGFSFFDDSSFSNFPFDVLSKEKVESYYSEDDFVVGEDSILSTERRTTISSRILNHPVVSMMDSNYLVEDGVYSIGDVLVSRNRFLRNFEVLSLHVELSQEEQISRSVLYTPYAGYTKEEWAFLKQTFCPEVKKLGENPSLFLN